MRTCMPSASATPRTNRSLLKSFFVIACTLLLLRGQVLANEPMILSSEQRFELTKILQHSLGNRGSWVSVHAAEAMIAIHQSESVIETFRPQADTAAAPYRIGNWRVLAQAELTQAR